MSGAHNQQVGELLMDPHYKDTQLKPIGTSFFSCSGIT